MKLVIRDTFDFVLLGFDEVMHAYCVGAERQTYALRAGLRDTAVTETGHRFRPALEGALGELAVAKYFRLPWDENIGVLGRTDVGPLEVRTTARADGHLIVKSRDYDEKPYLLVVVETPGRLRLAGWRYGHEAKQYPLKRPEPPRLPSHWVPQADLRAADELWPLVEDFKRR